MANTSKEFYLDFQGLSYPTEDINYSKGFNYNRRVTLNQEIKPRTVTLSLAKFFIFG